MLIIILLTLQLLFDIWVLYYLYTKEVDTNKLINHRIQDAKPNLSHTIPTCVKCGTIQNVIKFGDAFLCKICANHA